MGLYRCRADPRKTQNKTYIRACGTATNALGIFSLCSCPGVLTQRLCPAGSELFFFLTLWCLIVVLPTNYSVSPGSCCLDVALLCMGCNDVTCVTSGCNRAGHTPLVQDSNRQPL